MQRVPSMLAAALFTCVGLLPLQTGICAQSTNGNSELAVILTPRPGAAPRINGPKIYGARPGNPFLYRIPVQGMRPMAYSTRGLPSGLSLDPKTGIISGKTPPAGEYVVTLHAKNDSGKAERPFRIVSGDRIALTPPMGWNSWYTYFDRVTYENVRDAANRMISSGMADVGFQYINVDDCWMNAPLARDSVRTGPLRDLDGRLLPNKYFGDMSALTTHIHLKGLKAGIYSSPGPLTCAGYAGSYGHEDTDARTFADWGFDYLKYDWCSYGHIADGGDPNATNIPTWGKGLPPVEVCKYPYKVMGDYLALQPRDIVFNLCQYGLASVWEWGQSVDAASWRIDGDLGPAPERFFEIALTNLALRAYVKPGSWNDPDCLMIGWTGNPRGGGMPEKCRLTPNEQYSYVSLWVLMAAPLMFSGDMTKLDPFTINLLCNAEVIDVNQDSLGRCAEMKKISATTYVLVKELDDGSKAVGLFNRGETAAEVSLSWEAAGVSGRQVIRDLWRQSDSGIFEGEFKASVPRHGVLLVRLSAAPKSGK
jgi:alpha-galactosidase